jgi:predicted RNase H-like HicB family nuclease
VNEDETMRQVILYRGEDDFWVAECPSLPGCISQGRDKEEALNNIKQAIEGYILTLQEDGLAVPEDRLDAIVVAV